MPQQAPTRQAGGVAAPMGATSLGASAASPFVVVGSTPSAALWTVLALVVGSLAMLWAWRVARRRRLQAVSGPSTSVRGSGAFDGVLEQQSALIARLKEAGNRAYLQRDYEGAAQHFAQAVQETLQRCRLAHPELTLRPVAQARELTAAEQHAAKEADALGHGPEVASYPPPGSLSTTPNPHLAQLPVDTSNSLAIFYSNRSACLLALNRYEDALVDAECAVHCQPLWSKGFLRAGQAYESLGLFERAESMYLRGAQRDPRDENVARCVANLRSLQKEVADTRRAIARDEQRTRRITARRALTQSAGSSEVSVPQAPATALESDKFDKLTAWLLEHGARFPSLYLKQYSSEHRGVHTLCRIAAGKIVLEVPLRCIMTTDLARASPVGRAIDRTSVELSSNHSYLACYLLEERAKGDASFWSPYINILPREYASMPVFFDEEDKGWLKGSLTLPKIDERRRELANEYERICSKIDAEDLSEGHVDKEAAARGQQKATASFAELRGPFSARHNLSAFIWARSVVITRIFGFSMDVPANNTSSSDRGGILQLRTIKTDGLVPMADMLNHFRPRQTAWAYFNERGAFCITSLIPFTAGSEVCDSYGRKCQSRFFINYGFALLGNDEDNQAALWVHLDGRENVREGHLLADEDEDTDDTEDVLAKRKWLLAISGNQVDERAAASQSLQQSASSLSSSSFVLSPSVDDGDSSIVSSPSSFPPPSTLRFQLPTDPNDRIFKEVFSVLRVVVASTTARARAFTPPPAQDGSISASVALSAALRHAISKSHLSEVGAIDLIIAQTANGDRELGLRSVPPLSLRNELAVLHALRQAAQEALAQFSCTMAEDDVLLARDDELQEQAAEKRRAADAAGRDFDDAEAQLTEGRLTINQRNCVIMRRGEKQVLQHFIDMAAEARWLVAQWRAAIPLPNSDVAAASSSAGQTETPWDTFLTVVAEPRYGNQQQGPLVTYVTHVLLPLLRAETNFEKQQAAAAAAQR